MVVGAVVNLASGGLQQWFGSVRTRDGDEPSISDLLHLGVFSLKVPFRDASNGMIQFHEFRAEDCLSSVWEDGSVSGCEKPVPVTELVWVTTARLNAALQQGLVLDWF